MPVEADGLRILKDLVVRGLGYTVLPLAPIHAAHPGRLKCATASEKGRPKVLDRRSHSHYPARLRFGAIAQLGERYNGIVEVVGSIPSGSTKSVYKSASPSSRGLGHRPFTAATGVRIPVGTPLFTPISATQCLLPAT